MKLRYSVTLEDAVAFNRFRVRHSAHFVRLRRGYGIALPVVIVAAMAVFSVLQHNLAHFVYGVVIAIVFSLLVLRLYGRGLDKEVRRLYGEGRNRTLVCEHNLLLEEGGITDRTDVSSLTLAFEGIEKIEGAPAHTFIYFTAVTALVVPRGTVVEGDYDEFVAELRRRWEATRS